jgi:hypothetical protein
MILQKVIGGLFMKEEKEKSIVGLIDIKTHHIIAVYPERIDSLNDETRKMVKNWYYMKGCANEERLINSYVDILSESDLH